MKKIRESESAFNGHRDLNLKSHFALSIEREEIECGRNFLINLCRNKASLLVKMEYGDFMNSLVVRMDVFDDLTYLQKHLRLIIKIHQVSSQSP